MSRMDKLRITMSQNGIDGCLLAKPPNVTYISGFTNNDAYAVITNDKQFLLTDFRYIEQAQHQAQEFEVILVNSGKLMSMLSDMIYDNNIHALWFEDSYITCAFYNKLSAELDGIEMIPMGDTMERLRAVKDEDEVSFIKQAAAIADKAFDAVLEYIKPGITEKQLAARLEYIIRDKGCEGVSFPSIVASGHHSSMPHAQPSDKPFEVGEFITLDFGGIYNGYCSDMTRTVVLGRASPEQRRIYDTVLEAQQTALEGIKAGMVCKDADALARNLIAAKGYGEYFGHSLGHGVGLEIHELPTLSPGADDMLQVNSVVTVEPGIYIPGMGGVRIEDLITVRDGYIDDFTSSTKKLIEI
ncbi:M24 family metallopeptidase [Mahella australiensis]|uniref:Peptidase M24 n=1 Tax=Mahella australiensis (strain DSM 15567 / CIP 107919 / 50-1 BON) TaxID=697281 RepID=F4A159_MAHA5|nr:aminopeptidase P family protein [Mahella australiensis]AEE95962.1 peptidase M24 [Mahella australiensis 50-1 BON]